MMLELLPVILFTTAAFALVYVIVGYPLLLAALARWRPRPVRRDRTHRDSVSIVIAVRNGERWLARKLDSVLAQDYPEDLREIIIVSDGSTDRTDEIALSYSGRGVRLLRVPQGGKPAALNAAVPTATGNLLFITDVRQILNRDCLSRLVSVMADPTVGVVSGDLRISGAAGHEQENTSLYWKYENWIRGNLSLLHSMLGATGPVNLSRRALYVPIPTDSLLDDVFLPLSIHLQGYRLVLEPDAIAVDEPTDLKTEFRRKIRTQAGIVQLLMTFPGLFGPRNRIRFHFVSQKIGRLLLPEILVTLLVSAAFLPGPWRWAALGPQLAFWGLAAIDSSLPPGILKRLSSVAKAVAVLVWAAFAGRKVIFVQPRQLWVEARVPGRGEVPR